MNLSVIIPNYNGEELLKKNLPKVLLSVGDAEIIVVDDASVDGSLEALGVFKGKIKVVKNERNLGFSSAINRGVEAARGDIVVLLNTDVTPERGFLAPLLSHFRDDKVFAVGCMDKSIENGKVVLRGRGVGFWRKGFFIHSRGEVDKANTLWVNGGSGAFRKSIWEKLGGFSPLYNPFYWEDIDLSYRAQKSGYKILFEPKSIVIHEHEKGVIQRQYSSSGVKTIAYRNQFIFMWSNATDLDLRLLHLFWLPYFLLKALIGGDWLFFLGFLKAFILLPQILVKRFRTQKLFIKRDWEVVKEFQ